MDRMIADAEPPLPNVGSLLTGVLVYGCVAK
jgi:hypothetical protein